MKGADEAEPAVSYRVTDKEVQLRSPTDELPEIHQEAEFSTTSPATVPPPPHYSALPWQARCPSHGDLSRRLSAWSN